MMSSFKVFGSFPAATIIAAVLTAGGAASGESALSIGAGNMALVRGGVEPAEREKGPQPCSNLAPAASPSRPVWTGGAAISECGQLQADFGWTLNSIDAGIVQSIFPSSTRYGLTPKLELRWVTPAPVSQGGSGQPRVKGISDANMSFQYLVHEQGERSPAFAFGYGFKIPTANPRKGLGSGYSDHQFTVFVSRDIRRLHVDWNAVGIAAGGPDGHDNAAQFGLAVSTPLGKRLTVLVDNFGGSQPGTSDRYGAALLGATWVWKPSLVFDAAYSRAYTAGSPRQTFTVGFTRSIRLGSPLFGGSSILTRLLGR